MKTVLKLETSTVQNFIMKTDLFNKWQVKLPMHTKTIQSFMLLYKVQ